MFRTDVSLSLYFYQEFYNIGEIAAKSNKVAHNFSMNKVFNLINFRQTLPQTNHFKNKSTGVISCTIQGKIKQAQLRLCKLGLGTVLIFYTSVYMKRFALVVFAWKCRLFCLCAHGQCCVYNIYLSCGIPFPVWTPDIISGLTSVMAWLSRWEVIE